MSIAGCILSKSFNSQRLVSCCWSIERLYSRWSHRHPAKVLLPFEPNTKTSLKNEKIIVIGQNTEKNTDENVKLTKDPVPIESVNLETEAEVVEKKFRDVKSKREEKEKKRKFYLSQKKIFDDNGQFMYEKLKENDGRLSSLFVKLKSKKERIRTGQILVEGWRLIVDGLLAKCSLKYIVFSSTEDLHNLRPFLAKTGTVIYKIPYKDIEMWSDVETSPGIFGVFEMPTPDKIKRLNPPLPLRFICDNIRVPGNLGAILRAAVGVGCDKVLLTKGCVDIWDPKVIRSAAGAHFRLPIYHSIEWQDMNNHLEEDSSLFIADSNTKVQNGDNIENLYENIPLLPYYGIDYASMNNITLILGGETEGISEDSYRLTMERSGLRINIPLARGVDSLNTGMAAAVIAFEIKKQLIQKRARDKAERQIMKST